MGKPQSWSALSFVVPPAPKASKAPGICWNQLKPSMGICVGLSHPPIHSHPFQRELWALRRKRRRHLQEDPARGAGVSSSQVQAGIEPGVPSGRQWHVPPPRNLFPDVRTRVSPVVLGSRGGGPRPGRPGSQPSQPLPAMFVFSVGPKFWLFHTSQAIPGSPRPVSAAAFTCKPSTSGCRAPAQVTAPAVSARMDLCEAGATVRQERSPRQGAEPCRGCHFSPQNEAPECCASG